MGRLIAPAGLGPAGGLQRRLSVERLPVRAYPRRAKNLRAGRAAMRLTFANSFCITQPFENARARLLCKSLNFARSIDSRELLEIGYSLQRRVDLSSYRSGAKSRLPDQHTHRMGLDKMLDQMTRRCIG